jgi:hypothetical protein
MNATIPTGEHTLTESDRSTLDDIFDLAESHSRKCFDAERAYQTALEASDHFASDHLGEWIAAIRNVHAAAASAALARVRAFGGLNLDGKLLELKEDELERFLRPIFVEAGIEDDFLRDRKTFADYEPTLALRRAIAKWLREALEQLRVMERVQATPVHIVRLDELIRNARDDAEPILSYRRPLDDAIRAVRSLALGGNPSLLMGQITSGIKHVLADIVPEDRIDAGTPWEQRESLHAVIASANAGDEWAVEVLKAHPHLAFLDELTKKWVEQVDSGPRTPGISAQRDRIIRTRPPER